MALHPDDLLGAHEVAEYLGVPSVTLHRWRTKGVVLPNGRRARFPQPVRVLRATPVWSRKDIDRVRDAIKAPAEIEHI